MKSLYERWRESVPTSVEPAAIAWAVEHGYRPDNPQSRILVFAYSEGYALGHKEGWDSGWDAGFSECPEV